MVDGRKTTDGRTPEAVYTISSPYEPNGSGELKTQPNRKETKTEHVPNAQWK